MIDNVLDVVAIAITYVIAPLLAMFAGVFMFRRYKRAARNVTVFVVATVFATFISYPLGQLFIPLTYIAQFVIVCLTSWLVAKFSIRDSILFALTYVGLSYLFSMTLLYLFVTGYILLRPNPTNP